MDTSMSVPFTVAQAAMHAGVSTKTIRRWLTSGRLEAARGPDGAWLIDVDALDRAIATPGPSTDSPTLATGHGQVASIVQVLLDRLEQQAERIGHLDAELVSTRLQLADAQQQLLALAAPAGQQDESTERPLGRESDAAASGTSQQSPDVVKRAPWWAPWRRASV